MPIPIPGRVAEAVRRSTVVIRTESNTHAGHGSGAVVGLGLVITNAHVLAGAPVQVESWDGKTCRAKVQNVNRRRDLALLAIDGIDAPALTLADSDGLQPGTPVFAVGHPLGFTGAISSGIIHSIGAGGSRGWLAMPWIRSDLRLAPGNSGGPLANYQGLLVGINTMIAAGGVAFAVPSRAVQRFLASGSGPRLGVTLRQVRWQPQRAGLLLLEVEANGAAERASLLPGDILVGAAGSVVQSPEDLDAAMERARDGVLPLEFVRGGKAPLRHVTVQLQTQLARSAA